MSLNAKFFGKQYGHPASQKSIIFIPLKSDDFLSINFYHYNNESFYVPYCSPYLSLSLCKIYLLLFIHDTFSTVCLQGTVLYKCLYRNTADVRVLRVCVAWERARLCVSYWVRNYKHSCTEAKNCRRHPVLSCPLFGQESPWHGQLNTHVWPT